MQITKPTKHTSRHLPSWQSTRRYSLTGAVALACLLPQLPGMAETPGPLPESYAWQKVVNNLDFVPGTDSKPFNSYNQPSVNASGLIVFRARSKGPEVMSGIYERDMRTGGGGVQKIADRNTTVPAPNNTLYAPDDTLAKFNEFPSIPRISITTRTIATRGNSQPVWTYQLDGADTKAGTTGIFLNPGGNFISGVGLLGAVPPPAGPVDGVNYFPYMQVPGAVAGTKFDVFPG